MTAGGALLFIYDWTEDHRRHLRCISNLKRLTEEDSIFWFDMCGCRFTEKQDNYTSSSA